MSKYIKGMYVLWGDYDYIEKCIDAGINTLMFPWCNLYEEDDLIHDHLGHYSVTVELLEKYADDPRVDIILLPDLNNNFKDLPDDQAFYDGERYRKRTPCPTSEDWVIYRTKPVKEMCMKYNVTNVQYDAEHYGAKTEDNILTIWDDKWFPKHKCECSRCKNFSKKEQWEIHNEIFRKHLAPMNLKASGQLPYFNFWNFSKYSGEKWNFNEHTYPLGKPKTSTYRKYYRSLWGRKLATKLFYKQTIKICAGAWTERFHAKDFIKYLEYLGKKSLYDGYWLYPQARLSKYTRFDRDHIDEKYVPYYATLIDDPDDPTACPEFFKYLKEVNEKIDKYRKSWKFKLRKLLWL